MNLKGGYKILNLLTLVLIASVDGITATDITDVNTLEQLDSLKEYLDVSKQLKPILLRVKPSKEKVVMAELSRVDDVTLMIHAKLNGYELNIIVSYEQDEDTLLWYIDEAQYLYVKTVNSEVGIKGLIQADKDILSQIDVDYDGDEFTTIWFPVNIMPINIKTKEHGDLYFLNGKLVDTGRNRVYEIDEFYEDEGFHIVIIGEFTDTIIGLEWIGIINGNKQILQNTYNFYYPASAGTKLYYHTIHFGSDNELYIVTNREDEFASLTQIVDELKTAENMIFYEDSVGEDGIVGTIEMGVYDITIHYFSSDAGQFATSQESSISSDTVREL